MGSQYRTLLDLVEEAVDMAAYVQLVINFRDSMTRLADLVHMFEGAVLRHNDTAAQRYALWVLQALSDVELARYVREERGQKFLPRTEEIRAAELRAKQARAEKAIELWGKIPTHKDVRRGTNPLVYVVPTLPETKKTVLTEIATWWRETADESEADRLFLFLSSRGPRFEEDEKIIQDVIREATGRTFSVTRLARHVSNWGLCSHSCDVEVLRILANAWVRNSSVERIYFAFGTFQPLVAAESSPAAYKLVGECAKNAPALDKVGEFLTNCMSGEGTWGKRPPGYERVPGCLTVSFPSFEVISAFLDIRLYKFWSSGEFKEVHGDEWFETARRNVRRFQKQYPLPVILRVEVSHTDMVDSKVFSREEHLALEGQAVDQA